MLNGTSVADSVHLLEATESITVVLLELAKVVLIVGIEFSAAWVGGVEIGAAVLPSIGLALLLLEDHLRIGRRG